MGGDGGSTVSRDLIVQTVKRRGLVEDIRITNHSRFTHCALSGLFLRPPLVIDELGLIYNKEAIIEYLLDIAKYKETLKESMKRKETTQEEHARFILEEKMNQFSHIQRLSDVFQCTVTMLSQTTAKKQPTDDQKSTQSASTATSTATSAATQDLCDYILCPILDIKADGLVPFLIMRDCCCVMSVKGYDQIHGNTQTVTVQSNGKDKTVRACCLCLKPLSDRYQSDFKPLPLDQIQARAAEQQQKLTEKDKLTAFPLQNEEMPYITIVPPTDHDREVLEAIMIAKREHLGRPTPAQIQNQLKKQKILRSRQQSDAEQLVQLAPLGKQ